MTDIYDGIILGAGHNGLILQAYLGKAGLKTLAIERKAVAGGGLATLEDPRHPGFLHNTHAFFQRAITTMPWYADLELERHGARYIEPELNVALITREDARSNGGPTSSAPSRRLRPSANATPRPCSAGIRISCRSCGIFSSPRDARRRFRARSARRCSNEVPPADG
jgi:phytoene dehydrogenase-like protein